MSDERNSIDGKGSVTVLPTRAEREAKEEAQRLELLSRPDESFMVHTDPPTEEVEEPRVVAMVEKAWVEPRISVDPQLLSMLSYMRPYGEWAEEAWTRRFVVGAKRVTGLTAWYDTAGNYYFIVPRADGSPSKMAWSAHTDTVHRESGRQQVVVTPEGMITARGGSCLGADNGSGCFVLLRMLEKGVPGIYCFFQGEERGCIGSKDAAAKFWPLFLWTKAMVAFDRKDKDEVITHQGGKRTCSDAFARKLGEVIGLGHKPSARGAYTDTKSFVDVIGECTNVGVGYTGAHGAYEAQDGAWLMELVEAMEGFDEDLMVFERQPGEVERYTSTGGRGYQIWTPPVDDGYGGGNCMDLAAYYRSASDAANPKCQFVDPATLQESNGKQQIWIHEDSLRFTHRFVAGKWNNSEQKYHRGGFVPLTLAEQHAMLATARLSAVPKGCMSVQWKDGKRYECILGMVGHAREHVWRQRDAVVGVQDKAAKQEAKASKKQQYETLLWCIQQRAEAVEDYIMDVLGWTVEEFLAWDELSDKRAARVLLLKAVDATAVLEYSADAGEVDLLPSANAQPEVHQ